ncbi:MAG TPA: serine protease [Methanosarcinales archaeon]|nr:serine protease [Methanosarcinales archaeon]
MKVGDTIDGNGRIGAIIKHGNSGFLVTVAHAIKQGVKVYRCKGIKCKLVEVIKDYDLAIIKVPCEIEPSIIGLAEFGEADLITSDKKIPCRIVNTGKTLHFISFPCGNMPDLGDSGAPIFQNKKIVGILSSILFNNCSGIAISSNVLEMLKMSKVYVL